MAAVEYLFSYGTLRQAGVQLAVFGRELAGKSDSLRGFELDFVKITDPDVIASSGSDEHPILKRSADPSAEVAGIALAVVPEDVPAADAYEVSDYVRITVTLKSGRRAYVYVSAEQA